MSSLENLSNKFNSQLNVMSLILIDRCSVHVWLITHSAKPNNENMQHTTYKNKVDNPNKI